MINKSKMGERFWERFLGILFVLVLSAVFSVSRPGPAFAARQRKTKVGGHAGVDLEKEKALLKKAEEKINDTTWSVRFMRIGGAGEKESFKDALRFIDNKFVSKKASRNGFPATSFTLDLKGENLVVWETMQRGPNSNLDFWKGEIEAGKMSGVLSRHFGNKAVKDYSFVGTKKEAEPEVIPAKTAPGLKAGSLSRAAAKQPVKKPEKKKFWFW